MKLFCRAFLITALFALCASGLASVKYVKSDAAGTNDGSSWLNAFMTLETALQAAQSGDEIWVAAGTYLPTNDYGYGVGDRGKHFQLKNGVALYGGFAGSESELSERDWQTNETILSGDIGAEGVDTDNCYHLFLHVSNADETAILDGFTVRDGNANGANSYGLGGGMYNYNASPTVRNCVFENNSSTGGGGAIFCDWYAEPLFEDCSFIANSTTGDYGGAVYNYLTNSTFNRCLFSSNTAPSGYGGAIFSTRSTTIESACRFLGNSTSNYGGAIMDYDATSTMTNCVFYQNWAPVGGAFECATDSTATLMNCTFYYNAAVDAGGAIFCTEASLSAANCIMWGNSAAQGRQLYWQYGAPHIQYCDIQGCGGSGNIKWSLGSGVDYGGNIDKDPLFDTGPVGSLQSGSPCIDAGNGDLAPAHDIAGNPRYNWSMIPNTGIGTPSYTDIGAYEYQGNGWPAIVIQSPTAAWTTVERGTTYNISWIAALPKGAKVKVELVNGSDQSWLISAGASKSPLKWSVGKMKSKTDTPYPNGDDYKVRVSTLDGEFMGESEYEFAIGTATSLTVAGPDTVVGGLPAQYTCTAHYDVGYDTVVTNAVKWSCSKIKGLKMGKTGLLATAPTTSDLPCTITAVYGKGKPPLTGTYDVTIEAYEQ